MITAAASGKAYRRKQGIPRKYLFPYDLVERGVEGKAIKKGEATRKEYVLGLKSMEAQHSFIAHALQALSRHQETSHTGQLLIAVGDRKTLLGGNIHEDSRWQAPTGLE